MDIKAGSKVSVEVTKTPTTEAGRKTLARLFRKDPAVLKHERRKQKLRPSWQTKRRGGRPWHHQMKSTPGVSLDAGATYSFRATVDVIRDLESVSRWVKVSAS